MGTYNQFKEMMKRYNTLKHIRKEIIKYENEYGRRFNDYRLHYSGQSVDDFEYYSPQREKMLRRMASTKQYLDYLVKKERRIRSIL